MLEWIRFRNSAPFVLASSLLLQKNCSEIAFIRFAVIELYYELEILSLFYEKEIIVLYVRLRPYLQVIVVVVMIAIALSQFSPFTDV